MGLLRTAARASVAARVVGNVQRRQQVKWNAQDAAAAQAAAAQAAAAPVPAAPAPAAPAVAGAPPSAGAQTLIDQLTQLGQLRDSGVLTPEEFEVQKQRLLAS